ncbi:MULTISPECIES: hypothetical protein [unclassified Curtobacterium]|uniref:hypothetical protein n=1 Tax=Bacteria TaxID=2 RepID=UPI000F467E8F|nr:MULTISPECIES: hypothetical protein [unclassified Curtobacterium]NQW88960.1 hypothetical protein [Curtobacterium sp. VKM Ac-2861]ROQ06001.1 hypothetical protein EDF41_2814 [Curtobacterium sp. PhB171]ROQ22852.1 hypothetical protein EDF40_2858 [Curtobacterium sp. PhB170]ROS34196.1 hypothetical protein EDF25_2637 [Curtobacterium sp. PhB131]ROS46300.1 hypothetical protein EDF53_1123 [Curtobacterium sp. PhB78]
MSRYEVRLPYAMSETLVAAFPEFSLVQIGPGETLLVGDLSDQTQLHGLLARIADLGLDIAELRQLR